MSSLQMFSILAVVFGSGFVFAKTRSLVFGLIIAIVGLAIVDLILGIGFIGLLDRIAGGLI